MKLKDLPALIGFVILAEAAGAVGSFFTASSVGDWYVLLEKPLLNPPSWVFGPVWTTLYALMGIAAFLVWKAGGKPKARRAAFTAFGVQLALNSIWSALFFGAKNPGLAFAEIILLWAAILWTMTAFNRLSRAASALLAPYLAWVSFAAYLNFMLWILN